MSTFNSITVYSSDTNITTTEVPKLDDVKALSGIVSETFEVIQIRGSIKAKMKTKEYLGGYTLTTNDWKYNFTPIAEVDYYTDTLQSIEDKQQTKILSLKYHWLLLGETDGDATTEAWTKRYSTQPQAIKDSTAPLCLAVNLVKYDISFDSPRAFSKKSMEFEARKEGTVS